MEKIPRGGQYEEDVKTGHTESVGRIGKEFIKFIGRSEETDQTRGRSTC